MPNIKFKKTVRSPRSYDSESRKPRVTNLKLNKHNEEDESDNNISDQSDTELEEELEMPVKDDSRRKNFTEKKVRKVEAKHTSQQQAIHEQKESESIETSVSAARHMIMRAAAYHLRLAPITFPSSSTYIPSFYQFYEALSAAHSCIQGNTYLRNVSPDYISISSSLYYGFIGIIQILRAKSTAGIISRSESQCLRKFEREYPFESLPIMSPLIMFFQNLGAVKLSDPMYGWICPSLPEKLGTSQNEEGIFTSDESICLPNVPALLRFLYELGQANELDNVTDEQSDRLVPTSFVLGNTDFFGVNLNEQNGRNTPSYRRLIYSAGLLEPPEIPDTIDESTLKRIRRWNLPQLSSANDLQQVGQFLQTDGNLEWFKNLVRMASDEAKFFKDSTTLSNISPTTGLSSLVEISYVKTKSPPVIKSLYPISNSSFRTDIWKAQGITTRGETTPDEFKTGFVTQFLIRNFGRLVPTNHNGPSSILNGPYFDVNLQGRQVAQIESDASRSPSYSFELLIKKELFDQTGGQH